MSFTEVRRKIQELARIRSGRFISTISPSSLKNKRKLQDNLDPHKIAKYQKYTYLLDADGFRFPTDLLSNLGTRYLIEKLHEKKGMRAWEIPILIQDGLLMVIEEKDRLNFEHARAARNRLAHGRPHPVQFATALKYASELHTFAAKIDKHVCEHFFVIQVN